jgi:ATP-binding cassette subfamily F protein uup
MSLLNLSDVSYSWDGDPLLEGVTLNLEAGEHIGLVGRNGCGKSTLLKLLEGAIVPDRGEVHRAGNLCVRRLAQEVPDGDQQTVAEIIGKTLQYPEEELWRKDKALGGILRQMQLEGGSLFSSLSSGMKRRTLLAQAIVDHPDVLLLDEPTNHLDIEAIIWLEGYLKAYAGTLLFVTHDRAFLQALATRILEVDRGRLFDWSCNYQTFLQRKQATLESEAKQNANFDKKLAQEEVWIRKGIQARRTRNEGRVRALKKMRAERQQRRERAGNVQMQASEAERSGQLVVEAKNLSFTYGVDPVVRELSTLITAGDKIGIIGPNGAGKTTLIKLLLGELQPQEGSVRRGNKLETIYFDQLRDQIKDDLSIIENVADDRKTITINGRTKNVYSYLEDFLFTPDLARKPASTLSGGERNRLLLAKLFQQPANLIVMDEPTNDLDAETLELLEEVIAAFAGTLLLVSHDRAFLNNVVESILVFEGNGRVKEYAGGYDDYLTQSRAGSRPRSRTEKRKPPKPASQAEKQRKLTYKEKLLLESLPDKITQLENEQGELQLRINDPDFFKSPHEETRSTTKRLEVLEIELLETYALWEDLDARA